MYVSIFQPLYISAYSLKNDYESAESYRALGVLNVGHAHLYVSKETITSINKYKKRNNSK